MNQSLLKSFAPQARTKFSAAIEQRAKLLGLSSDQAPVAAQVMGDKILIAGMPMPAAWEKQRQDLGKRIKKQGWQHVIDEAAYTWFNRLSALRYMEVHNYIPQGVRVLTAAPGGIQPEILTKAQNMSFLSFSKAEIIELKMDGTRDEELYRRLILALCESLHESLPLLFPAVHEDLELLLPENLLRQGSLLDWFVTGLPDEEWQEIEVLGWLYQYYISELKDQYMARKTAYKKEEIPAVTQLFTPKWIVEYLVHNSLGRSWILHHPESSLKTKMPYYIEPAQQEPEVEAELKRLFSGRMNPEDIKLLDPAMGSGHILVTAYEVLREIYLEQGYQRQQCARLILEKNLFGLDIDLRATEIACFALIMKAREDDPTILTRGKGLRLNLLSFRDCTSEESLELIQSLNPPKEQKETLEVVLSLFEQGTLFGSLIQVPESLVQQNEGTSKLVELEKWLLHDMMQGSWLAAPGMESAAETALVFIRLAKLLGQKYDQVVSNPPYLGVKGMSSELKSYIELRLPQGRPDLFAAFMLVGFRVLKNTGFNSMVTLQNWMFLSSFEDPSKFRSEILNNHLIINMAHLGARAFSQITGEVVQTTAFSILRFNNVNYIPNFIRLVDGTENDKIELFQDSNVRYSNYKQSDFFKIPNAPLAYWKSIAFFDLFKNRNIGSFASPRAGLATGDNDIFQRYWHECSIVEIKFNAITAEDTKNTKWFPCNSGGENRRWYGNHELVVNWKNDGEEIRSFKTETGKLRSRPQNTQYYFKEGVTWNKLSTKVFSVRYRPQGFVFDDTGRSAFPENISDNIILLQFLSSNTANYILKVLNPSMSFTSGDISKLPIINVESNKDIVSKCVHLHREDWDAFENSWDFQALPWLPKVLSSYFKDTINGIYDQYSLGSCWDIWRKVGQHWVAEIHRLEEENNRLFIAAYGLQDELSPEVPITQITLTVNPWYRYKPRKIKNEGADDIIEDVLEDESNEVILGTPIFEEGEKRMRADGAKELVSYALGCLMGRYSLDAPGLVYAEAGGVGFDPNKYKTFQADDDGIVTITDYKWFSEDAAVRVEEFIKTVWGAASFEENIKWLADNLGLKPGEYSSETLRRYLANDFYKDHLSTYKKRPIYWKFSSGKEKAFEALVYLHRYSSATLSRMRMQFVVPLTGQMRNRLDELSRQLSEAPSTQEKKRIEKEQITLQKKFTELTAFDEDLNHYAQQQIELDLDDGVRVNYGKFGNLLANVKDVCGKGEE